MYFPQRFKDWLLTCLPHHPWPRPEVYRFFLVQRAGQYALEYRDAVKAKPSMPALDLPESFCAMTHGECVDALTLLFQSQMTGHGPVGQALGERVLLQTAVGTVEIRGPVGASQTRTWSDADRLSVPEDHTE